MFRPDEKWIRVELWYWLYGELPGSNDMRELNIPKAIRKMSKALEGQDRDNMPTPAATALILSFAADLIEKDEIRRALEQ